MKERRKHISTVIYHINVIEVPVDGYNLNMPIWALKGAWYYTALKWLKWIHTGRYCSPSNNNIIIIKFLPLNGSVKTLLYPPQNVLNPNENTYLVFALFWIVPGIENTFKSSILRKQWWISSSEKTPPEWGCFLYYLTSPCVGVECQSYCYSLTVKGGARGDPRWRCLLLFWQRCGPSSPSGRRYTKWRFLRRTVQSQSWR